MNDVVVDDVAVCLVDGLLKRPVDRDLPERDTGPILLFPTDLAEIDATKEPLQIRIIMPVVEEGE